MAFAKDSNSMFYNNYDSSVPPATLMVFRSSDVNSTDVGGFTQRIFSNPWSVPVESRDTRLHDSRSTTQRGQQERISCSWAGCKATFSRKADLKRHMTSTHGRMVHFDCDVHNCARKGDNGFVRRDHLLEHKRGYHAMDIPKRHVRKTRLEGDIENPQALPDHTHNRKAEKPTQNPGSSLNDDDVAYLVAQPAWTARSTPYRPLQQLNNAQPTHQSQWSDWKVSELDLLPVPSPTITQFAAIIHHPEVEAPPNTPDTARDCTPASTSTQSMIESEGERSFIYTRDYIDQFSVGPDDHALALSIAQLSLQKCIEGSSRALQKTNTGSTDSSTSQNLQKSSNSSSSPSVPGSRSSIKRSFNSDQSPGGRDDAEDNKDSKKICRSAADQSAYHRLLACPYYRFDVGRYSERNRDEICYRGCSSVCLRDISRLKQHLYRVHRRPDYYCGSCYCVLSNQSKLDAHTRQRPACENAPSKYEEKIHRDQMNAIKRRTMGTDPIEEWFRIYAILFSGSTQPPVSYVYADGDSSVAVQEYLTYFQVEAPSLLLELVRSQTDDRILLSEEQQNILNEAFEYATSRVVSRLRPELDEYGIPRPNLRNDLQTSESIRPSATLARSTAYVERPSRSPRSDPGWSIIRAGPGDWPDLEQEEWLDLNLAEWEHS